MAGCRDLNDLMSAKQPMLNRESPQAVGLIRLWNPTFGNGAFVPEAARRGSNGTTTGSPVRYATSCPTGGNFNFDGVDDLIDCGSDALPTSAISISAWVLPTSLSGGQKQFVSKGYDGTNTQIQLAKTDSASTVDFTSFTSPATNGVTSSSNLSSTAWQLVLGTFNGTTYRIYLNGKLDNSNAASAPTATTKKVYIGAVDVNGSPGQYVNAAYIGEVRIYGRALTAAEAWAMYDPRTRFDVWYRPRFRPYTAPAGASVFSLDHIYRHVAGIGA